MKFKYFTLAGILLAAGCASPISKPASGPTAELQIVSPDTSSSLLKLNVQNLSYKLKAVDGSWEGEQFGSANSLADKTFEVPAEKSLLLAVNVLQGGPSFDGTCGATEQIKLPANSKSVAEFKVTLLSDSRAIGDCMLTLYRVREDGTREQFGQSSGGAHLREWVLTPEY